MTVADEVIQQKVIVVTVDRLLDLGQVMHHHNFVIAGVVVFLSRPLVTNSSFVPSVALCDSVFKGTTATIDILHEVLIELTFQH